MNNLFHQGTLLLTNVGIIEKVVTWVHGPLIGGGGPLRSLKCKFHLKLNSIYKSLSSIGVVKSWINSKVTLYREWVKIEL